MGVGVGGVEEDAGPITAPPPLAHLAALSGDFEVLLLSSDCTAEPLCRDQTRTAPPFDADRAPSAPPPLRK